MASRSSRSPTGLHSTSPISLRIEDLLNITVNMHPPPSPRVQRIPTHISTPHRNQHSSTPHSLRTPISSSYQAGGPLSVSPPTTSRRASLSASFSPRVVRGAVGGPTRDSSTTSHSMSAPRASLSLPRVRRASSSAHTHGHRTASAHIPHPLPIHTNSIIPPPSQQATSFPRPAYLEHSAFRHCIISEPDPPSPPEPYRHGLLHASAAATSSRRPISPPSQRDTDNSDEDSNIGSRERGRTAPPSIQRKPSEAYMHLPTRWSDKDRCPNLSVSVDGRDLTFHGASIGGGDKDAAAARANYPIPPACGIYYYEITILNKGQRGHIGIGFSVRETRLTRLPGWEVKSWGYHGDDGRSFAAQNDGLPYGPTFTEGDVVGCGIDFTTGQAFFTKNGQFLGSIFQNIGSHGDLCPTVGLRTPNESIRANFGQEDFKFNILGHVALARHALWENIQSTPILWSETSFTRVDASVKDEEALQISKPINELVLGYLTHHGYGKTVKALKMESTKRIDTGALKASHSSVTIEEGKTEAALLPMITGSSDGITPLVQRDAAIRQGIVKAVSDGDIDTALEETQTHFPDVLKCEDGIMLFKLRCRKFVELVLDAATAWRQLSEGESRNKGKEVASNGSSILEDAESMEIDDDEVVVNNSLNGNTGKQRITKSTPSSLPEALQRAISNGQSFREDYQADTRPEVQAFYKRALALVAYEDPLADDPKIPKWVKELADQSARDDLAEDLNRAILESQGCPPHAPLERLYRHTQACLIQLGWSGAGVAAFADMPKEFMDI